MNIERGYIFTSYKAPLPYARRRRSEVRARQNDSIKSDWRPPETLESVWREPRPRQSYSNQSGGRQTDSKVDLAAARQTPECIWRAL
ncbi:hypothetical protein PoB_002210600 [Plakobranchus ocellatus]|uniref:Uncharacterized protein n=1 Tax=Plakobranchus ocellatus TaxID=259542 RepID=A0AAV3Z8G6_9GAST|nr:hypothetical protein PoB_002210600 [Plakobranchus ocellatus]